MMTFCTLFDTRYLSRGLAMVRSLEQTGCDFRMYIFAFDSTCYRILNALQLPGVTVIPLGDFEDDRLLAVKPSRTPGEYCWTSTSSTILYVLERYGADHCTYVDADLFFYADPAVLLGELGQNSVLITEHRYTPRYDKSKESGTYCVQFITFRNTPEGLTPLRWWRERCLEWCYNRVEDGKFGDQKYLDGWPERFPGVHVLQHPGGGLAAWNIQQVDVMRDAGILRGREKNTGREFPVIFYHFHYLQFLSDGRIELGRRLLSHNVIRSLYVPYLHSLEAARAEVFRIDPAVDPHGTVPRPLDWKSPLLYVYRTLTGVYNVFPHRQLLES